MQKTEHVEFDTPDGILGAATGLTSFMVAWVQGFFSQYADDIARAAILAAVSATVGYCVGTFWKFIGRTVAKHWRKPPHL